VDVPVTLWKNIESGGDLVSWYLRSPICAVMLRECSVRGLRTSSPTHPIGVKYPGYRGSPVTAQNYGYDMFPLAANGWGIMHPVPKNDPTTPG
jgi:hypothetical protein